MFDIERPRERDICLETLATPTHMVENSVLLNMRLLHVLNNAVSKWRVVVTFQNPQAARRLVTGGGWKKLTEAYTRIICKLYYAAFLQIV